MTDSMGLWQGRWLRRAVVIAASVSVLAAAVSASAADRDRFRRENEHRREWRGRDRDRGEHRGPWRFEPRRGWRFERHPGVWSPFYVWWWLDGRAVLRFAPTVRVMRYRDGYYELRGDGIAVPYYWVWIPAIPGPPPLPPPVGSVQVPAPPPPPGSQLLPPPPPAAPGGQEAAGTIIGGAVGGALGATIGHGRTAGIIVGTLLGALVGHDVGRSLDEADELRAAHVLEMNKTGQASSWVNPDTKTEVTVVPRRTFQEPSGEYCREYQADVIVGGQKQQAYGTACRQPDGEWKVVK